MALSQAALFEAKAEKAKGCSVEDFRRMIEDANRIDETNQ